ncbi:MAG TPA: NADH-quinone oxidoreductase subunit J [Mucilaginibacter sp.]|nr:NADH-quinone oxidoreductase subunit J [Mucilaginibacter sp.]
MTLLKLLFYLMAFIAVASAVFVALTKNLVRSIFMFFVTLFALAGLYVLALADFVAITQIVIYVGGILVLILFAFMLSGREALNTIAKVKQKFTGARKVPAMLISGLFLIVLINMFLKTDANDIAWVKKAAVVNNVIKPTSSMTENIGINLMTKYLLPFEAISILLMIALVGAAHLSRKEGRS